MFLLSAQKNFYIKLSSYVKGYVKSEFHVFSWFPCLQNVFFEKVTVELVWKSFSGRNNSLEPPVSFYFLTVVLYGLEESIKRVWSFELIGFSVTDIKKLQKKSACNFFFFIVKPSFWIYEFLLNTKFCFF